MWIHPNKKPICALKSAIHEVYCARIIKYAFGCWMRTTGRDAKIGANSPFSGAAALVESIAVFL